MQPGEMTDQLFSCLLIEAITRRLFLHRAAGDTFSVERCAEWTLDGCAHNVNRVVIGICDAPVSVSAFLFVTFATKATLTRVLYV